jgi:hypothetical protein
MMLSTKKNDDRTYRYDITFFLLAIPFISAINFYLTYSHIQFNSFYLIRYLVDTSQGYLAWWAVRWMIIQLDRVIPYEENAIKRIILQQVVILIMGNLIIIITTELLSLLIKGSPAPFSFYSLDMIIISIWFFMVNGVYVGLHYYHQSKQPGSDSGRISVTLGKKAILLEYSEIACLQVADAYTGIHTFEHKLFFLDKSLNHLEHQLPSQLFFRINRQVILHRTAIRGFRKIENGKLEVESNSALNIQNSVISRTRAPHFKQWLKNT